ncbi:MAG: hypothetical protein LBN12_06430 [Clostridiales Family XIII bacterium]|nr:hypothetical protein [Clostridiales Family XIII bacterium]
MENRRVAQAPELTPSVYLYPKALVADTESYINDNIGFREFSAFAYQAALYNGFDYYADTHYLQGKDHNLFYLFSDKKNPESLPPAPPHSEIELLECKNNLEILNEYYTKQGIPFLFCTIPDKDEVYPELYPDSVIRRPGVSRLTQIAAYLNQNSDIDTLDLAASLRGKKSSTDMLYYKTFDPSHWNGYGAYIGYQNIMYRLKEYFPDLAILDESDFIVTKEQIEKTIPGFDFTFNDLGDVSYKYEYADKAAHPSAVLADSFGTNLSGSNPGEGPISSERYAEYGFDRGAYYFRNPNCDNGKKLLIFGDSYISGFILDYIAESFSEVYFIEPNVHWGLAREASDSFAPDAVMYEIVDRVYPLNFQFVLLKQFGEMDSAD